MERVAFLVEETGERIDCLLNPESMEVSRLAGVRSRTSTGGLLTGAGLADDPLHFTGGGRTEMVLDLLFDVELAEGRPGPRDVRTLTRKLWQLAENSAQDRGGVRPPQCRLVWGKSWNLPGVITAVAERFDAFDAFGSPSRSWLRMKLVRVAESAQQAQEAFDAELSAAHADHELQAALVSPSPDPAATGAVRAVGEGPAEQGFSGVRVDLLATDALGSPFLWRRLAAFNGIDNPFTVAAGAVLAVPPPAGSSAVAEAP
jgi:hypothetical protein